MRIAYTKDIVAGKKEVLCVIYTKLAFRVGGPKIAVVFGEVGSDGGWTECVALVHLTKISLSYPLCA